MASAPDDSPTVNLLSPRNKLYSKINKSLSEEQVIDLRAMLITDHHIAKAKIENKTPHEIFTMLEADNKIGEGNLGLLSELLFGLNEAQLAKEVEDLDKGQTDIPDIHSKHGFKVVELKTKTGRKPAKGSSIPLILSNDLRYNASTGEVEKLPGAQRSTLQAVPEALALLEGIEGPVSVLAICGPCRTGKSYILSRLLGTADAFELGHRMDPQTFGIWMGTKVLRGKGFTIVLLDTEGIDAVGASAGQDASILVMTILLSSRLIYNSIKVPRKADLEGMQCFIQLSKRITVKHGRETQTSEFHEFFPDFLWLLRDVSLKMEDDDGKEMDPTEYLRTKVLHRYGDEEGESTSGEVGRAIFTFFPSVDCAKLEGPSVDPEVTNNIAQHTDKLNQEFNKGVQKLIAWLLKKSRVKRSYDKKSKVTGEALSTMIQKYVEVVNEPKSIIALDNTWKTTVDAVRVRALEEAVREYKKQMQSEFETATDNEQVPLEESTDNEQCLNPVTQGHTRNSQSGPPRKPTLMDLHKKVLDDVTKRLLDKVGHFDISSSDQHSENKNVVEKRLVKREDGSVDYVAADGSNRMQEELAVIGGELVYFMKQNKAVSKSFCRKLIERLLNPIREQVESHDPDLDFDKLKRELGDALTQYEEKACGPEKRVVQDEMTQSIENLKAEIQKIERYQIKVQEAQQKAREAELRAEEKEKENQQLQQAKVQLEGKLSRMEEKIQKKDEELVDISKQPKKMKDRAEERGKKCCCCTIL